jgi:hypothetical protein
LAIGKIEAGLTGEGLDSPPQLAATAQSGLEVPYVRPTGVRAEWQLYELDTGKLLRCPPKDESRRMLDVPAWLAGLLSGHLTRVQPKACDCHGREYVLRGYGSANGAARRPGPKLVDVARRAGVSTGTVSAVLNRPASVPEATRVRVELAADELGYLPVVGRASRPGTGGFTDDRGQHRSADLTQAGQGAGELAGVGPPVGGSRSAAWIASSASIARISRTSVATSAARSTNATAGCSA